MGLGRGRNAMATWQELGSDHGFPVWLSNGEALCAQASWFGVNAEGFREALAVTEGWKEDKARWD
jgi:hypothetical protein